MRRPTVSRAARAPSRPASGAVALCAALLALGSAAPAGAQGPTPDAKVPPPQTTTATYQDWVVRCEAPADKPKVCEIAQGIQARADQGLIAQIVVGRPSKTDPMKLIIELPPGVWLPAGATLQAGEKATPLTLTFKSCPRACFADLDLKPEQVQALKAASGAGTLSFEDGARQKVQLPISFAGFSAALDASLAP